MIYETIDLLGKSATDKVSGFTGVVTSVCFDLYGCVQTIVTPKVDDKGVAADGRWFDVNRLTIHDSERAMPVPNFDAKGSAPSTYEQGCDAKPLPR